MTVGNCSDKVDSGKVIVDDDFLGKGKEFVSPQERPELIQKSIRPSQRIIIAFDVYHPPQRCLMDSEAIHQKFSVFYTFISFSL